MALSQFNKVKAMIGNGCHEIEAKTQIIKSSVSGKNEG
jgi:hypothetical protein